MDAARSAHSQRQGVIGALADFTGGAAFIGDTSHDSRSLISPALQVGKHSGGVFGWHACAGSGGIRGGSTGGGGKVCNALLQPATSCVSQYSISPCLGGFEFGFIDGELVLADEVLTPDSSRFWPMDQWRPGGPQASYDKQFVRDYLERIRWNKQPPAPVLPEDVVMKTSDKYCEAYRLLTGTEL